jgi:hypothetical protein
LIGSLGVLGDVCGAGASPAMSGQPPSAVRPSVARHLFVSAIAAVNIFRTFVTLRLSTSHPTILSVSSRLILALLLCLTASALDRSPDQVRRIILASRHLGAHGLGYNDSSLTELSHKLGAEDIPTIMFLLPDRKLGVGLQFALASQCAPSITPVRDAVTEHKLDFLAASDIMDLITGFSGCNDDAKQQATGMRDELQKLRQKDQEKAEAEARWQAAEDARIQENGLKMLDPQKAKTLTREEREEVFRRSLKAMGLCENGPMTPDQKKLLDRMYRTMVLGESTSKSQN